ncbi:MAG: hypothetical protein ACP5PN_11710, partial [Steroidobacteraceae bacterium]
ANLVISSVNFAKTDRLLERHLEPRQLPQRTDLLAAALRAQRRRLSEFAGALLLSLQSPNNNHRAPSSPHERWEREAAHDRGS